MIKLKYVIVLKVKEHIPFEGIHSYCFKWKICEKYNPGE